MIPNEDFPAVIMVRLLDAPHVFVMHLLRLFLLLLFLLFPLLILLLLLSLLIASSTPGDPPQHIVAREDTLNVTRMPPEVRSIPQARYNKHS